MSLKELPYSHFKVAVEELNHRYKVCVALGSLIEELSEVGSAAGKNLSKLGTQNFLTGNQQWLPTCSVALESIHKMTTSSSGKQLVGHASNLSQNISKTFPEQVRLGKKRVVTLAVKIGNQVDEYKKAKLLHTKNVEKYQRLALDTEAAIRSRAAANEIESRSTSEKESVVVQGDNFMNRSLNKMLSKIAPEKKIDDRCKDMVRELDVHERAVVASNKRLVVMRSELMGEITKAMNELEELESQRLHFMREGMTRFCLAAELIGNQQSEMIASVLERTNKLVANDEAIQVMREIDRPSNANSGNSPVKKRSESSDSEDDADTGAELAVLFGKAEKLGEALEYFRSLVVRATNSMLEVAEVEATYYRSAHKVLDRHGYCRNAAAQWVYAADYSAIPLLAESTPLKSAPLSAAIGAVGATTLALTSNLRSGEYLGRFESPLTKSGWEQVVNSVGTFADLQLRGSEVAGDDVCQQLELVTQRLEIGRKELMEKLAQNSKMVENAKQEVKKVTLKLTKCQALLRERRDTLKQVKDILIADSASTLDSTEAPSAAAVAAAAAVITAQQERDGVGSPDSSSLLGSTLDEPLNSPAPAAGDSYSRKQGIFRKGGLKQVVGLETQADRVSRIEKQVATLEEEERDLVEALASAEQALVHFTNVAKTQVLPIFDATREFISTDLVTMKSAIEVFMSWKSDSLASFRNVNRQTKKAHDDIDISRDLSAFTSAVQTAAEGIPKDQAANPSLNTQMATALNGNGIPLSLLDVPEIEPFAVVNSDVINQEREVISKLPPVSSTLYSISNLAMNYGGNSDAADGTSPGPSGYSVFKTRDRKGTEDSLTSTGGTAAVVDTPLPVEPEATSPVDSNGNVTLQTPLPLDSAGLELAKFGLTSQDKVMESYSCALYPKKGLLTHGRMFVTQHYLAFSGWPETRVLLLVRNIKEVNRMNTLYYVPNALSVVMLDESEYFFGSFIDREQCYALLVSLNDVGKHMSSLPDFDPTSDERNLEFGYLTQNNLFGGASEMEQAAAQAQEDAANSPGGVRASPGGLRSPSPAAQAGATTVRSATPTKPVAESPTKPSMMSKFANSVAKAAPLPPVTPVRVTAESPVPTPQPQIVVEAPPSVSAPVASAPAHTAAQATVTASKTTTTTTTSVTNNAGTSSLTTTTSSSTFAVETKPIEVDLEVVEDGVNQSTLYERSNIALMQEKVFNIPSADIWQSCWAHAKGYGQFLLEEGEIEITFTEWVPCASPKALEDLAKLNFCFCRKYDYLHPRTTMLMFGPKNAPTSQMQYLYLPIGSKKIPPADLSSLRPTRGVIFTCTTLQGIPMCDVFKVLQYWSFERHGGEAGRTEMKVGMGIHYLKSSMFKAQIYNGTKEELILQSLKWLHYAERCCLSKQALPAGIELVEEPTVQATLPGSGEKVQVRRSSLRRMSEPELMAVREHAAAPGGVAETANAAVAALSAAATTTTTSIDVSLGTSEEVTSGAVKHEKSVTIAAATKTATLAAAQPHGEFALQMHLDVNYVLVILACAVAVLLVLLYRQSSYNSALVQQINLLSRKIEMSQTAMEISLRQSQSVVHKMETFINNIQK